MSYIFDTLKNMLYIVYVIYTTFLGENNMNNVRTYRKELKLSQLDLAKKVQVSRQTINLIENDKYNPSLDLCIKIAKALNTDLNTLFWVNIEGADSE